MVMGSMQRRKGQSGERELAGLIREHTGWDAQRRVRQHDGDSDVLGVPGWCIEVKRHATATRGEIAAWWGQASGQTCNGEIPVLFYRADRGQWRAVWPLATLLTMQRIDYWRGIAWTADTTIEAWAAVARELHAGVPVAEALPLPDGRRGARLQDAAQLLPPPA